MTQATGAVCEIKLKNGSNCGVTAIGRCSTCERAFCASHQAHHPNVGRLITMCAPCFAKTPEEVKRAQRAKEDAERDKHMEEQNAARQYFRSGSARAALRASGAQLVNVHWVRTYPKTRLFGKQEASVVIKGHGWLLGEFRWLRHELSWDNRTNTGETKSFAENWLTILLDLSPFDAQVSKESIYYREEGSLVCGRLGPGGYVGPDLTMYSFADDGWIALAQAVRRLTGAPS